MVLAFVAFFPDGRPMTGPRPMNRGISLGVQHGLLWANSIRELSPPGTAFHCGAREEAKGSKESEAEGVCVEQSVTRTEGGMPSGVWCPELAKFNPESLAVLLSSPCLFVALDAVHFIHALERG